MVAVPPASAHRGVERDPAVRAAGPGHAGVRHLPAAAGQRPSQRRLPAVLLQAGVQPQRLGRKTGREAAGSTAGGGGGGGESTSQLLTL